MVRTGLVALCPVALVGFAWLRLEQPRVRPWEPMLLAGLAIVPALLPRLRWRLAALAPAAVAAAWVALGPSPFEARPFSGHDFFGPFGARLLEGVRQYYDVSLPFAGEGQPEMRGLLSLAVFAFAAGIALAVAARRPSLAVLATVAGVGWPATLLHGEGLGLGALTLAACLGILAGLRRADVGAAVPALLAGAVLVVLAVGVSSAESVAKGAVLHWQAWDAYDAPRDPVRVDYVWEGSYDGIRFPEQKTPVLRVWGPDEKRYWRATTLDQFTADRWLESLVPLSIRRPAVGRIPAEPLTPPGARGDYALERPGWTRYTVDVLALADDHLVAPTTPISYSAPTLARGFFLTGGVVRVDRALRPGVRYEVVSYVPQPTPANLARTGTGYPAQIGPYLELGRARVDPFGTPGRQGRVDALFADDRYQALWPYRGLYERARAVAGDVGTPYGVALALEAWFRDAGGFRYTETPPVPVGAPPLADFVDRTKAGYCQHYAGAMALMLRFLGVPARVAAGFTSGTRQKGFWLVTDHDAHAWVEVWFPGYGWLPFDPTPGRGTLQAAYTTSSQQFNARDTLDALNAARGGLGGFDPGTGIGALLTAKERNLGSGRLAPVQEHGPGLLRLLGLGLLAVGGGIGLVKLGVRRARYATGDPRRLATAARRELADFLADQRLEVPASATAGELAELVRRRLGVDARGFAAAAATARFGRPEDADAAARTARREVRALLRVLRTRLSRRDRLRGFVAVRSLRA
jgi:transglutaminase-like putative cysteine protease